MSFTQTQVLVVAALCFGLSIAMSAYAWSRTSLLSLPLPTALAAVGTFLPVVVATTIPGAAVVNRRLQTRLPQLPNAIPYLLSLFAVIILTIALNYSHPSPTQTCQLETTWSHLFRTKDAEAIRTIQSTLRCCGFRSTHDRAWPFPSRDVDAGECERTSGYSMRCFDRWRREESRAAGLIAIGSVLIWAFTFALHFIVHQHYQTLGHRSLFERRPLLEDGRDRTLSISERRQIRGNSGSSSQVESDSEPEGTEHEPHSGMS